MNRCAPQDESERLSFANLMLSGLLRPDGVNDKGVPMWEVDEDLLRQCQAGEVHIDPMLVNFAAEMVAKESKREA